MNHIKLKTSTACRKNASFITGFTLIELMIVLVIISILAGLVVGAIRGAQQDTYAAKTRATISKIEAVINDRTDEYLTKDVAFADSLSLPAGYGLGGVPPDLATYTPYTHTQKYPTATNPGMTGSEMVVRRANPPVGTRPANVPAFPPPGLLRERTRLAAIRDVMRMEMPDCIGDLYYYDTNASSGVVRPRPPVSLMTGYVTGAGLNLVMRAEITPRYQKIHNRLVAANAALAVAGLTRGTTSSVHTLYTPGIALWSDSFANEELLFLIVEDSFIDGETALTTFGASEIADVDGDGLREFVDAWGVPIRWLRWPAGVRTVSPATPDPLDVSGVDTMDGFDPSQADVGYEWTSEVPGASVMDDRFPLKPTSGLRPMIVSAGLDGRFGIRFNWAGTPLGTSSAVVWPLPGATGTFSQLGYWPAGFIWPDPFYPRIEGVSPFPLPPPTQMNPFPTWKLGGIIEKSMDVAGEVHGVDLKLTPPVPVYRKVPATFPGSHQPTFEEQASDNVSNLDESGAAP